MAIGTTNVSFSAIATEVGATANANVSLQDLGQKQVILNPGNSRQTYTLTDSITLTTQDSAIADNMNMGGSNNYEVSEFKSYDMNDPIVFSSVGSSVNSESETINVFATASGNCIAPVRLSGEIYCSRVGNDLVWYVSEGNFSNFGVHNKEGNGINGATECARLAGIASNTSTTVSVAATTLQNNNVVGSTATVSSGSTSSNLVSTNTKIGFDSRIFSFAECTGSSGRNVEVRMQLDFTVTHPDKRPRKFRFFVGLFGTFTTTNQECC